MEGRKTSEISDVSPHRRYGWACVLPELWKLLLVVVVPIASAICPWIYSASDQRISDLHDFKLPADARLQCPLIILCIRCADGLFQEFISFHFKADNVTAFTTVSRQKVATPSLTKKSFGDCFCEMQHKQHFVKWAVLLILQKRSKEIDPSCWGNLFGE